MHNIQYTSLTCLVLAISLKLAEYISDLSVLHERDAGPSHSHQGRNM